MIVVLFFVRFRNILSSKDVEDMRFFIQHFLETQINGHHRIESHIFGPSKQSQNPININQL